MNAVKMNLTVNIAKQGSRYLAYSPALDISTSGKDEAEAKKRFEELVDIFFEELQEAGTTDEVLTDLGWHKGQPAEPKHAAPQWMPPRTAEIKVKVPVLA